MPARPVVEYYFSFISSWSYIGSRRIRDLAQKHNAQIIYKPVDLMRVFAASGGLPVKDRTAQRQAYRLLEIDRWGRKNSIPIVMHTKYYPADPSLAHRVLLAAIDELGHDSKSIHDYVLRSQDTVWADEANIEDSDVVSRNADASGLDGPRLLDRANQEKGLSEREQLLTCEMIEQQHFGAPTYVYRGEPFWGQDRLDLVDEVIQSGREPIAYPPV
ncbi:HCCA isomerase/glutathione S-transferase kappa [Bimuria novae-zelandiae CBS 107.79]|uniref:Glutathione S-transferase kappa n=1 Tax=Bimuria novae-zelandiae CBS 107.79 TaxID=1447943 RepID=A0A6A5V7Q4_9PLEO|nr:HCCA isomerase/glutathione S-transferase kappa [Bimuria novae-zelandiae CBS 107.79]